MDTTTSRADTAADDVISGSEETIAPVPYELMNDLDRYHLVMDVTGWRWPG